MRNAKRKVKIEIEDTCKERRKRRNMIKGSKMKKKMYNNMDRESHDRKQERKEHKMRTRKKEKRNMQKSRKVRYDGSKTTRSRLRKVEENEKGSYEAQGSEVTVGVSETNTTASTHRRATRATLPCPEPWAATGRREESGRAQG